MSDFDDLDDLIGPLRGSATPAELASESEMVELMATTHRHAKGTIMFSSRRARVATLIAAGVIGFGGVAAAARPALDLTGLSDDGGTKSTEEIEVEDETTTTVTTVAPEEIVVTTTIADEDDDKDDDTLARVAAAPEDGGEAGDVTTTTEELEDPYPETAFNEAYCLDGNHGKTVSAVARGDDALDDAVKDAEVVDAAHSKCGKMDDAADETDDDQDADEVEDADESDDAVTTPQDTPEVHESTGNPNQGNGNANRGNGNQGHGNSGNGNGKKND